VLLCCGRLILAVARWQSAALRSDYGVMVLVALSIIVAAEQCSSSSRMTDNRQTASRQLHDCYNSRGLAITVCSCCVLQQSVQPSAVPGVCLAHADTAVYTVKHSLNISSYTAAH
jgi:hypothetical protein